MNNLKVAAAVILTTAVAVSCTHEPISTAAPAVSFKNDIVPVLTARCALNSACHSGAVNSGNNINLDSAAAYTSLQARHLVITDNPAASLLYVEVSSGIMPKAPASPLDAAQINMILNWIKQGAPEN